MPFRDLPGAEPCFFKKGERLIKNGEKLSHVFYLKKGLVHREIVTSNGVESILSCKEDGRLTSSIVGLLILYRAKQPGISRNDFVAMTDCYCVRIPVKSCKEFFYQHPALLEEALATAIGECEYLMKLYLHKSESPASAMFCQFILSRLIEIEEKWYLPKEYNNIELSKLLNLHKVTVSRMICVLKNEQIIERTSKGILIIDKAAIEAYANNERQMEYS